MNEIVQRRLFSKGTVSLLGPSSLAALATFPRSRRYMGHFLVGTNTDTESDALCSVMCVYYTVIDENLFESNKLSLLVSVQRSRLSGLSVGSVCV